MIFLISCQEKEESKLDFERLGIPEENRYTNLNEEDYQLPQEIEEEENPKLSFWDKENLKLLKSPNTPNDSIVLTLNENDFEYNFKMDTSFFIEKLSESHLELLGTIKNKTHHSILFYGTTCHYVGPNLIFNENANFVPYINCNMSWARIISIEPNETFKFKSTITIKNKRKKITSKFKLRIISNHVDIKNIVPIKTIILNSKAQYIPKELNYIIESNF